MAISISLICEDGNSLGPCILAKNIGIYGRYPHGVQPIGTYSEKKILVYEMGKYTLYVYLLHGFVIKTFRASPFEQWIGDYQLMWLLVPAAIILVYILSSQAVR